MTELEYLKGFLDYMQSKGVLSEQDLADYNQYLEAKRITQSMIKP